MKINTICQFCGFGDGHRTDCPILRITDQNNTFIAGADATGAQAQEIEAIKAETARKEGYEQGVRDERGRWINQPANEHDERIRRDERERILKSVQGQPCKDECQVLKERIINSLKNN